MQPLLDKSWGHMIISPANSRALKSGRDFQAGDQISYYVTGTKKSVAIHESAKLVSEWDPSRRDENVPFYLAKLDALIGKFDSTPNRKDENQPELF